MPDDIDHLTAIIAEATRAMDEAAHRLNVQEAIITALRQDRAELRRALYEVNYCLAALEVPVSSMTKTTADTLVRLNLGGFND